MTQKDLVWHECLVGLQGCKSKHQHHSKFALYTFYFTSFCNSLLQLLNGQTYQKRKVQKINGTKEDIQGKQSFKEIKIVKKQTKNSCYFGEDVSTFPENNFNN